jgi:predicted ArsR family transcriptional regulator
VDAERPAIAAVAALDDDVRRALYQCVREAPAPVTREDAAAAVGISRKLAAFHLDKLVAVGLLRAGYVSGGSRRVGRAPKTYEPSGQDVTVAVPARRPELLAELLLETVLAARSSERLDGAACRVARGYGERLGAAERDRVRPGRLGAERGLVLASAVCARYGYQPVHTGPGSVRLRNCPFHPLAARAPELVCAINREFLSGMLAGLGARGVQARLEAQAGECCVELRTAQGR